MIEFKLSESSSKDEKDTKYMHFEMKELLAANYNNFEVFFMYVLLKVALTYVHFTNETIKQKENYQ